MKAPSKKAGLVWLVVVGLALWWLLRSSPASAAERPLYGPPTPDDLAGDVPEDGPPDPGRVEKTLTIDSNVLSPTFGLPIDDDGGET